MPRFFVPGENISGGKIIIEGDDAAHIGRVLRMRAGDSLTVCDGAENDFICNIIEISKKEVICAIVAEEKNCCEPEVRVTLFQGMPKGQKMEYIIQKCVEAGVSEIAPFISSRTVAKGDGKPDRYAKISAEAAKQCGRGIIPQVSDSVSFEEALSRVKEYELAIFAYEEAEGISLKDVLRGGSAKSICVFIGPEGGFEESEAHLATEMGCAAVTLGKRILRTETAGIAVISSIMYEYEA